MKQNNKRTLLILAFCLVSYYSFADGPEGIFYLMVGGLIQLVLTIVGIITAIWYYKRGNTALKYITLLIAFVLLIPGALSYGIDDFEFGYLDKYLLACPLGILLIVVLRIMRAEKYKAHPFYTFLKFLFIIILFSTLVNEMFRHFGFVAPILTTLLYGWLGYDYAKNQLHIIPQRTSKAILKGTIIMGTLVVILSSMLFQFEFEFISYFIHGMNPFEFNMSPILVTWLLRVVVFCAGALIAIKKPPLTPVQIKAG